MSVFPAPDNPIVVIGIFAGNLGLDDGVPRSVYTLDTTNMTTLDTAELGVGQTLVLPNGAGSVTFVGFDQWATFQISRDPGKGVVLVAVAVMVLGLVLSLRVRRRRLWVRATTRPSAGPGRRGAYGSRGRWAHQNRCERRLRRRIRPARRRPERAVP